MLKLEWNALRVGDAVVMHDPTGADLELLAGTVVMVQTKRSKRGANGVGVRVGPDRDHRVLWPSSLTTHADPPDPTDDCWRCAELVGVVA
jgi:hypothetical protein